MLISNYKIVLRKYLSKNITPCLFFSFYCLLIIDNGNVHVPILKTIMYEQYKQNLFLSFQLARAYDQFIIPLENFRKEHIGGVKVNTQ